VRAHKKFAQLEKTLIGSSSPPNAATGAVAPGQDGSFKVVSSLFQTCFKVV
jgi:hypothetical protein